MPPELAAVEGPVVLFFGLLRPYKGIDAAARGIPRGSRRRAVGGGPAPFETGVSELEEMARRCEATVRFVPRFVADAEVPALFRRADLVVLPHRDAEQSGVLYTALAFGNAVLMSDVGGFPEVAALGAGRLFESGDADALASALVELLGDPSEREALGARRGGCGGGPVLVGSDRGAAHRPVRRPAAAIIACSCRH